jgi:hypothetical protein
MAKSSLPLVQLHELFWGHQRGRLSSRANKLTVSRARRRGLSTKMASRSLLQYLEV